MADDFSIDIKGLAEAQKKIYQFNEKLGDRITQLALRSGANYMLKRVRQAAPKKTGRLRRAIVVKNSRFNQRRKNGVVGLYLTVKSGKRTNLKTAYYGTFVEHGHKKVKGIFFVRNTYHKTKKTALKLIVNNIEKGGKALLKKL